VVEKSAWAPDEVQQQHQMLTHHALLVTEKGALGVAFREDVAKIVGHHFNLLRYEFHVFRSHPKLFIILFSDHAARNLVYARWKVSNGS
jgi:hypothetical protein